MESVLEAAKEKRISCTVGQREDIFENFFFAASPFEMLKYVQLLQLQELMATHACQKGLVSQNVCIHTVNEIVFLLPFSMHCELHRLERESTDAQKTLLLLACAKSRRWKHKQSIYMTYYSKWKELLQSFEVEAAALNLAQLNNSSLLLLLLKTSSAILHYVLLNTHT